MKARCELGIRDARRAEWNYSVWVGDRCFRTGTLDLRNIRFNVTPDMAKHLAMVLEGYEKA